MNHLERVYRKLAAWHTGVVHGKHYAGEGARGDDTTITAAAFDTASAGLPAAHSATSVVRWLDEAH